MRKSFLLLIFLYCCRALAETKSFTIPPIVVTPKKMWGYTLTHGARTVISQEEITSAGSNNLSQILNELAGVQLQDITGNNSQVAISMRGFGANASSNTLLLINGIPISNPDLAPPDLNAIPLPEIESIEVISGSESVLYGDQAVGGAINILTQNKISKKKEIAISGGSYNNHNISASLQDHYKQLGIRLTVLNQHTDNYRANNDYDQNFIAGGLDYPYATGSVFFNYQITNERMRYPGPLTAAQVRANRRQAKNDTDFFRDWNGFYTFQNKQRIGSWLLQTTLSRREMHGDGVLHSPFNQSRIIHFIKPELKGRIGKIFITGGADFEDDKYNLNGNTFITTDSQKKYGLFGIANYHVNSCWSLSIGARLAEQTNQLLQNQETTDNLNKAIATTLGTSFQLNPYTNLYLRRAESFRFPKADENASTPPGVNGLKTQRGVSYETGITWNKSRWHTQVGIYQLNLRDEIMFDPTQTPENPFGTNRNLDPTVRQGFTVSEKYYVNKALTLDGQYNYVNARFQNGIFAGNRIPLVSENILHAGVNYKITPQWNLYTEAVYTGNQYPDNDDANIAGKIGGYTICNLNLRYYFKGFSAAFRVNNIFNKYYYFYTVYQPIFQTESFYPAPGRNFLLTLKYDFT